MRKNLDGPGTRHGSLAGLAPRDRGLTGHPDTPELRNWIYEVGIYDGKSAMLKNLVEKGILSLRKTAALKRAIPRVHPPRGIPDDGKIHVVTWCGIQRGRMQEVP